MKRRKITEKLLAKLSLAVTVLALVAAAPSVAATAAAPRIDSDVAAVLADSMGITITEARTRIAQERTLDALGDRIEKSLAGDSGGVYLDKDGELVVTVLDRASKAVVRQEGAQAKLVDDSSAQLDAIMSKLDRRASTGRIGEVQSWYVNVPMNTVVVTVTKGAHDPGTVAMKRLATSFGDSVTIKRRPAEQAPQPTAVLVGGFSYQPPTGGGCSIGFNTLTSTNYYVVLTAGHCLRSTGYASRSGYYIGRVRNSNYPTDDFGTFWNEYPTFWRPSPSVYRYDTATYIRLLGQWNNPPVGATVCKSGLKTGFTCGRITALDVTASYGANIIYGLTQHNACVEPGDSGGSNISGGAYALGVTSGASLVDRKYCLSRYGQRNVSWYQPIGEALSRNGLRLLT